MGKALGLAAGARPLGTGVGVAVGTRPAGTALGTGKGARSVGTGTGVRAPDTPLGQGDAEAAGCPVVLGTRLADGDDVPLREASAAA